MPYPAHEAFVAPARPRAQIWRTVLGLALILAIYAAGFAALFGLMALVAGLDGARALMAQMGGTGAPTSALLVLATFIGMALGPLLVARLLHKRRAGTLFGPARRTYRDFIVAMAICAALYGALALIPSDQPLARALDARLWLMLLPLTLAGILLQTGAEEILFRGYLQQQLAARFASPVIWMILPSVIFALGHYQPQTMGDNAWLVVLAVGLFAILAADLTAVTGSIGAAWGYHFANNTMGIAVVSMDGPLSGLALFTLTTDPATLDMRTGIWIDMTLTVITWAAIRYAVTRRR